jgi:hypothetical protein
MIKWGVKADFEDAPTGERVLVSAFGTVEGDVPAGTEETVKQQATFAVKDVAAEYSGSVLALVAAPGTFAPLVMKQLGTKLGKATVNVMGLMVSESDLPRLKK